jgi:VanZ family protein
VVLYCAGLFVLSAQPPPVDPQPLFPHDDKVKHAVLYAGLAALVFLGLVKGPRPWPAAVLFWAPVAFAVVYGISDELHQAFVPGRAPDPLDVAADGAGALAVQALLWWRYRSGRREAAENAGEPAVARGDTPSE